MYLRRAQEDLGAERGFASMHGRSRSHLEVVSLIAIISISIPIAFNPCFLAWA